jgi:hypothetical protein
MPSVGLVLQTDSALLCTSTSGVAGLEFLAASCVPNFVWASWTQTDIHLTYNSQIDSLRTHSSRRDPSYLGTYQFVSLRTHTAWDDVGWTRDALAM